MAVPSNATAMSVRLRALLVPILGRMLTVDPPKGSLVLRGLFPHLFDLLGQVLQVGFGDPPLPQQVGIPLGKSYPPPALTVELTGVGQHIRVEQFVEARCELQGAPLLSPLIFSTACSLSALASMIRW